MARRLLTDEHIPARTIAALRQSGHDVVSSSLLYRRSLDRTLLEIGEAERRLVVTFDRDFGALIFAERVPQTVGVIYLRITGQIHAEVTPALLAGVDSDHPLVGYFTVIKDNGKFRSTILPDLKP